MMGMNLATKYGNYCAFLSVSFILLLHYTGVSSFFVKGLGSFVSSLLELVFLFLTVYMTRKKEYGGYIDFKLALRAGITMVLVNGILFALFQYLYYQFIEPSFLNNFLPEYAKWSKVMGKSDKEIDTLSGILSNGFSPISAAWSGFSQMLIWETFAALIIARILRRNPPEQTQV
jgi:hypothetical protein